MFHRSISIIAVSCAMAVCACVATALRFAARKARYQSYILDDILVVIGLVSACRTLKTQALISSK